MVNELITVTLNGQETKIPKGTTLESIKNTIESSSEFTIVAGTVNNELRELTYPITEG